MPKQSKSFQTQDRARGQFDPVGVTGPERTTRGSRNGAVVGTHAGQKNRNIQYPPVGRSKHTRRRDARLAARQANAPADKQGYCRPGSQNRHKSFSIKSA